MFFHAKEDVYIKYDTVPRMFDLGDGTSIDGFDNLTDEERVQYNFFPGVELIPPYDPELQYLSSLEYEIQADRVVGSSQVIDKVRSVEEIIAYLDGKLQDHYDAVAAVKQYGIPNVPPRVMCALRAGMIGSPFQPEGIAFGAWMDACNAKGYAIMSACLGGLRAIPTAPELIAEMPEMVWPQ